MKRLLPFTLIFFWGTAYAQYNGPAVESCRTFARRELAQSGAKANEVVFDRDAALTIERYTRKVGNQFVSSILTGNGAVVLEGSPSAELSFICLLADEKRPVFFWWLPRHEASALAQCTRSPALRQQTRACLDFLMQVAEQDLGQVYGLSLQEARTKGEALAEAHRTSNAEWLKYREAECLRQSALAPAGTKADDYKVACEVDLTRRRLRDVKP